jgi:stringent starvation protein B
MKGPEPGSTRPYLIRALYEWCTDNGLTPYVAVQVDESVQVPREFVKNNEIVLNISFDATSSLKLGDEFIEFKARFGGLAREIVVPIQRVIAIYARENGQGMAFPVDTSADSLQAGEAGAAGAAGEASGADGTGVGRGRSSALTRVPAAEGDRPQLVPLDSPASAPELAGDEEPPPRPAGGGPRRRAGRCGAPARW